ncbi:MAG: hypothetical protein D3906_17225 [Candidatus Electrothrix sp. AUS1_2]|nr:hypothetical protein [Candidatus Electrothrix sp. AUS1_2]
MPKAAVSISGRLNDPILPVGRISMFIKRRMLRANTGVRPYGPCNNNAEIRHNFTPHRNSRRLPVITQGNYMQPKYDGNPTRKKNVSPSFDREKENDQGKKLFG